MPRPKKNLLPVTAETLDRPLLEEWVEDGICCKYVQFSHKPIPTAKGNEPVWEFKLDSLDRRYQVNSIFYTPNGLVFSAHGEMGVVPLTNVAHVRPI